MEACVPDLEISVHAVVARIRERASIDKPTPDARWIEAQPVRAIALWLGDVRIGSLQTQQVAAWQSPARFSRTEYGPRHPGDFRSIADEVLNLDPVSTNPADQVRPPKARPSARWPF
jgi:hypothetical protein